MSISVSLSPKTAYGLRRLLSVERLLSFDRPFTMSELDETDVKIARWAWRNEILTIVDDNPLRYEVTVLGRVLVKRGREKLREIERESTI